MKKILVLVALATMVASSSFGGIVGSKHDMLTEGATGTTEVCVFCHTPHGGTTTLPLWNRNPGANPNGTNPYTSSTLDVTTVLPGDGAICMSCHDGTFIGTSTLINDPGVNMSAINLDVGDIAADMTNDHPVQILYTEAGAGMQPIATPQASLLLKGGAENEVWCSSCHDVHNFTNSPFLRISNANSALCVACHDK